MDYHDKYQLISYICKAENSNQICKILVKLISSEYLIRLFIYITITY